MNGLLKKLTRYRTIEEICEILEILNANDRLHDDWKILQSSVHVKDGNIWIYSTDEELCFFDVVICDFVDLAHCTASYILDICEEIGKDEVMRLYTDEVELAEKESENEN